MATSRRLEFAVSASRALSSLAFCGGSSRSARGRLGLLCGCAFMSSACGAALYCGLRYGFGCGAGTSLLASGPLAAAATLLTLLSRQARCLGALLMLATGARETRRALASAAVLLVLTRSLRNAARNVEILADCFQCVAAASLRGVREFLESVKGAVALLHAISRDVMTALDEHLGALVFRAIGDRHVVDTRVNFSASLEAIEAIRNYTESVFAPLEVVADALSRPLFNGILVALNLLAMLVSAARYFRRYGRRLGFDNVYITGQFRSMDSELSREGEQRVLPLSKVERAKYISLGSAVLSSVERRAMVRYAVPAVANALLCAAAVAVDYGVFLLADIVYRHMLSIAHEHIALDMNIKVNLQLFVAIPVFKRDDSFRNDMALIGKNCVDKSRSPTPPDKETTVRMCVLFAAHIVLSLLSPINQRLRRKVVSLFYPEREEERIRYLHKKILDKRRKRPRQTIKLHRTLLQSVMKHGKRERAEEALSHLEASHLPPEQSNKCSSNLLKEQP